ncbi:Hypothetical protein FKW44_003905, partial [Caligus rogercresseyi]
NNSCNSSHHPHPLTPSTPLSSNNNSYKHLVTEEGFNASMAAEMQRENWERIAWSFDP